MSKLDKLLEELCPDGVKFLPIGDLVYYEQPGNYIVKSTNYDDQYETPVLTAGQSFILGYTNETEGIYQASEDEPAIIFDDFTGAFKWVDFPFKVKSSAMKILSPDEGFALLRYVFHLMGWLGFTSTEHKRLWINTYSELHVPVPPLEVQREIVRVLDHFTLLSAELSAELKARKKQYEYYRDKLLSFDSQTEWKTLGDIGKVSMCKRIMKNETSSDGDIPFFKIGTFGKQPNAFISRETFEKYRSQYSYPNKGDILISAAGTIGRTVVFDGEPAYFQDSNIVWVSNDETQVLNDFLYYWYQTNPWKISTGGTIARLYNDNIAGAKVPVLPIEKQRQIVQTLNKFDSLCADITAGLPAEIEARKQQYEYYRDKLLTFKELEN